MGGGDVGDLHSSSWCKDWQSPQGEWNRPFMGLWPPLPPSSQLRSWSTSQIIGPGICLFQNPLGDFSLHTKSWVFQWFQPQSPCSFSTAQRPNVGPANKTPELPKHPPAYKGREPEGGAGRAPSPSSSRVQGWPAHYRWPILSPNVLLRSYAPAVLLVLWNRKQFRSVCSSQFSHPTIGGSVGLALMKFYLY